MPLKEARNASALPSTSIAAGMITGDHCLPELDRRVRLQRVGHVRKFHLRMRSANAPRLLRHRIQ